MATILYTDGRQEERLPANGATFTLAELQAIVGGLIDILDTPDGRYLIINDEGKLEGQERNEQATQLMHFLSPGERAAYFAEVERRGVPIFYMGDPAEEEYIAGVALLCTPAEVE